MIPLSVFTCAAIALACAWIARQIFHARSGHAMAFRLALAMISLPYLLKVLERVYGDAPTAVDLVRDLGVLILLVTVIVFHKQRFGKL
jgi:Kef-type K+ transport system membrane component KefB